MAPFLSAFPPTLDPSDTHMCTHDPSSPGVQRPRVSPEPAAPLPVAVAEGSRCHPCLLVVCHDRHPFLQGHTASPPPLSEPPSPRLVLSTEDSPQLRSLSSRPHCSLLTTGGFCLLPVMCLASPHVSLCFLINAIHLKLFQGSSYMVSLCFPFFFSTFPSSLPFFPFRHFFRFCPFFEAFSGAWGNMF